MKHTIKSVNLWCLKKKRIRSLILLSGALFIYFTKLHQIQESAILLHYLNAKEWHESTQLFFEGSIFYVRWKLYTFVF